MAILTVQLAMGPGDPTPVDGQVGHSSQAEKETQDQGATQGLRLLTGSSGKQLCQCRQCLHQRLSQHKKHLHENHRT